MNSQQLQYNAQKSVQAQARTKFHHREGDRHMVQPLAEEFWQLIDSGQGSVIFRYGCGPWKADHAPVEGHIFKII